MINKNTTIPVLDIDFNQFDPKNLSNWGTYMEIDNEKKLLEMALKNATMPYLIEGDKGTGKTLLVHTLCRELKYPLLEYSCSSGTTKSDLIGRTQISADGSYFEQAWC